MARFFMYKYSKTINEINVSREQLDEYYNLNRFSTRKIAELLGTSQPTVRKLLTMRGIKLRTYKDNKTPNPKGSKMPEGQRLSISKTLKEKNIKNWINPDTGLHYNYQKVSVNCVTCGVEFNLSPSRIRGLRHFCGMKCSAKWKSENLTGANSPIFSSIDTPCKQCGKNVLCPPNRLKKAKYGIFCSHECNNLWKSLNLTGDKIYNFKGGYENYYGPTWAGAKKLTRIRDNNTCQNCFRNKASCGKNMDVHHIIPFRVFGVDKHEEANSLSNLICYCNVCHKILEEKYLKFGVYHDDFSI